MFTGFYRTEAALLKLKKKSKFLILLLYIHIEDGVFCLCISLNRFFLISSIHPTPSYPPVCLSICFFVFLYPSCLPFRFYFHFSSPRHGGHTSACLSSWLPCPSINFSINSVLNKPVDSLKEVLTSLELLQMRCPLFLLMYKLFLGKAFSYKLVWMEKKFVMK